MKLIIVFRYGILRNNLKTVEKRSLYGINETKQRSILISISYCRVCYFGSFSDWTGTILFQSSAVLMENVDSCNAGCSAARILFI